MRTVADTIARLRTERGAASQLLVVPPYSYGKSDGVGLAVESMKRHTTNEGWEIFAGLEHSGYKLVGYNLAIPDTLVPKILEFTNPGVVVMQDKREWDVQHGDFRETRAKFYQVGCLKSRQDVFKLTILKDAHQRPEYHRQSADEIGCHAWIIYYHPRIVKHLAPYVREEHLIRTYHSLDQNLVPGFLPGKNRGGALLSGAVSSVYPLRLRLFNSIRSIERCQLIKHPGYGMRGCITPEYLKILNQFRVAICTSSIYGYALRKIIEATSCGCIVVTDLPTDEVMPEIDGNLVRIDPGIGIAELNKLLLRLYKDWDDNKQKNWAEKAKAFYDYREVGERLVADIETLRRNYCNGGKAMNEEQALQVMVAPGQRRPGKYRSGVIQIHLTRACDLACFSCTQGSNLRGKATFMPTELFRQAVLSLKDYWGVVGIFGGNPALSPFFEECCKILREYFPKEQCGLWCNHPRGNGKVMRETFNPAVCNLNCHLSMEAYNEFKRDWPESAPFGHDKDSRHSPPFVALKDLVFSEEERWSLIANCPINKHWSAMLAMFRGQLRAYFCEIAGAQSILHQEDQDYPDTGMAAEPGWWKRPMQDFREQVKKHCHECGVPLQGHGQLAQATSGLEQVTSTHEKIYLPKKPDRRVSLVMSREELGKPLARMTDYMGNAKL